ncbi:MAG: hypothetical protein ABJL55_22320 [Roseibium sp.]
MCCRLIVFVYLLSVSLTGFAGSVKAEGRSFRLSAPDDLVASGFLKYLLPRFSLKTGIRINVVSEGEAAEVVLSTSSGGKQVFSGLDKQWSLETTDAENEYVPRFMDWMTGKVGRNTIGGFAGKEGVRFTAADAAQMGAASVVLGGDFVKGEALSVLHCGRCHIVNEKTRLSSIGSTPSFAVMRSFKDWQRRFEGFFTLNPHPSFTIIEDVTEPFDPTRPSPIVPVKMTVEELDEILAFVSRIPPADLGAPIQYQ